MRKKKAVIVLLLSDNDGTLLCFCDRVVGLIPGTKMREKHFFGFFLCVYILVHIHGVYSFRLINDLLTPFQFELAVFSRSTTTLYISQI